MSAGLGLLLLASASALGGCKGDAPPEPAGEAEDGQPAADATPEQAGESAKASPTAAPQEAGPESDAPRVRAPKPAPLPSSAMAGSCDGAAKDDGSVGVLVSPKRPAAGESVTVIAATLDSELPLAVRVEVDGGEAKADTTFRPGVPSATLVRFEAPEGGFDVVVGQDNAALRCEHVKVGRSRSSRPRATRSDATWPVKRSWTAAEEALFSAWVREMFTAPRGEDLAWKALHEVTSDPKRNLLHNHFGWSEDSADTSQGLFLRPDCADAPYFLRAYFAWKRSLPFAFRQCSRGKGKAPRCGSIHGVVGPPEHAADSRKPGELGGVQKYFRRTLAWGVHSGNGRTAFGDDDTDFYPVALERRALRPGTIYADPYGHIFVLVELMPPEGTTPGVLYAIDGQPDGSITRKRFWEGNFLFNPDPTLGGSGFKAFRPVDVVGGRDPKAKTVAAAGDADIRTRKGYGDVSDEQSKLTADGFYDKMDALVTPGPRDPFQAQEEAIQALFEAAKVRVTSVQNGVEHLKKSGGAIAMPDGHAIFETTGAWENFSTPARDLRLLIAIDLVQGFAAKVERNADVFLAEGESMEQLAAKLDAARKKLLDGGGLEFDYTRSDGSTWTLSVADVIERAEAFEMAYNPNDCPEVRWGAPAGSEEAKTCKGAAPGLQRRKMKAYRMWFERRQRPARGDHGPKVQ